MIIVKTHFGGGVITPMVRTHISNPKPTPKPQTVTTGGGVITPAVRIHAGKTAK